MDCLLIFDNLNDLLFKKYNRKFGDYIQELAISQGLLQDKDALVNNNVLIQIFSPIVTSHRIMHCQFGNSYTSIRFHNDLLLTFSEFMGYLFMAITDGSVKSYIQMCVTFARYLCGPDIYQLQAQKLKSDHLANLIDQWLILHNTDQAIFVEAVEQLVVNKDISFSCLKSLRESITELALHTECSKVHALLLVDDKFLAIYSSPNAKQLAPADILFTTIFTHCQTKGTGEALTSHQVFLAGTEPDPKCLPHAVHIVSLYKNVFLVYLVEIGNPAVSAALYESFHHLHTLQFVQIQREKDTIELAYENAEMAIKKLNDSLKKSKIGSVETLQKELLKRWDIIKSKYKEYLKTTSDEAILRAETLTVSFLDKLKELLSATAVDDSVLVCSGRHVAKVIDKFKSDLAVFEDFFKVKSIKNFSLGSDSLTIYKYLEEFPGLVHFLFVDRNTHRVTTPSLHTEAEEAEFIRQKDKSGGSLKIETKTMGGSKIPGILCEDYYMKLKTIHFPKISSSKLKCYELFCMYLGLITPAGVLEQTRRLAATIWDIKGFPTDATDLL